MWFDGVVCLCNQYKIMTVSSVKIPKMAQKYIVHNAVHNVNSLHHNNIGV